MSGSVESFDDAVVEHPLNNFAEALQELVNTTGEVLSVVEVVGVLELVKSELLAVAHERSIMQQMGTF